MTPDRLLRSTAARRRGLSQKLETDIRGTAVRLWAERQNSVLRLQNVAHWRERKSRDVCYESVIWGKRT
jgi:hypothetical protein